MISRKIDEELPYNSLSLRARTVDKDVPHAVETVRHGLFPVGSRGNFSLDRWQILRKETFHIRTAKHARVQS